MNNSIVAYLKANAPLLDTISPHVILKRTGSVLMGRCPLGHRDSNPSFSVNLNKNHWRCYSCGKHGDAIGFIRELHQCSFVEACRILIESFNIPPPENLRRKLIRAEIRQLEKTDLAAAKELARQL